MIWKLAMKLGPMFSLNTHLNHHADYRASITSNSGTTSWHAICLLSRPVITRWIFLLFVYLCTYVHTLTGPVQRTQYEYKITKINKTHYSADHVTTGFSCGVQPPKRKSKLWYYLNCGPKWVPCRSEHPERLRGGWIHRGRPTRTSTCNQVCQKLGNRSMWVRHLKVVE